jgi:predicted nucleotide-binding protein
VRWIHRVVVIAIILMVGLGSGSARWIASAQDATPVSTTAATIPERPRVFIASSVEGLPIATAIALDLQYAADVTIWNQGVFPLSGSTLAALDTAADRSDFAVVVLTADDVTMKRGREYPTPRDNVLFELGFFMGRLGVERTFMVYSRDEPPSLPTDLAGVTAATYAERADNNIEAEVGPASTQIMNAMRQAALRPAA